MGLLKSSELIFLAMNISFIFAGNNLAVNSVFRLQTNLDNMLFQHGLLAQCSAETVLECSLKCLMMDNCVSFQIRDDLDLCRLYWTHFLLSSTGKPSTDWKTYSATGPCKKGYLFAILYGYCFHYIGQFSAILGAEECKNNGEELIKIRSREENVFVSGLAYSFVNNTEGAGSNKVIIDGVFSSGSWLSLYGDKSNLTYTNFFQDEALGSENDRVNIRPSSSNNVAEYDWTSQPGMYNTRTILCRYFP